MPAEVAQSPDPTLVRRLWRPVERPGLIDPAFARGMLARHQRMVAGLPLAELLSRHTGLTSDLDGASVLIVYALPSRPPPVPAGGPSDAQRTTAPSHPIVSARPAQPVAGPAGSVAGLAGAVAVPAELAVVAEPVPAAPDSSSPPSGIPQSGSSDLPSPDSGIGSTGPGQAAVDLSAPPAVPVTHDVATPLVVQRTLTELSAPGSTPAVTSTGVTTPLADHGVPIGQRPLPVGSVERLPLDLHTSQPGSFDLPPPHTGIMSSDPGPATASLAQPGAGFARSVQPGQSVQSATGQGAPDSRPLPATSPAGVATGKAVALLVVQPKPAVSRRLGPPSAVSALDSSGRLGSSGPVAWRAPSFEPQPVDRRSRDLNDGSGTPLVVARPAPAVAPSRTRRRVPLLLVDLAAATSRPARTRSGTAEHQESGAGRTPRAGHVPGVGHAVSAPRSADRAAQTQARQQTPAAPMDVEHIVDAVHRRFVRRLAIEAERRAVR